MLGYYAPATEKPDLEEGATAGGLELHSFKVSSNSNHSAVLSNSKILFFWMDDLPSFTFWFFFPQAVIFKMHIEMLCKNAQIYSR